jgi:DNA polymerase III epsilon subunit-like protein
MSNKKPVGYFEKILAIDTETSGMIKNRNGGDPSHNDETGESYQIVSIGLIVASAITLKPIEELYIEIKWDGVSKWSPEAEKVHGLSLQYLEDNGVDREEAVTQIGNLVLNHWGPDTPLVLLGHNVVAFDLPFFKQLMLSEGIDLRFGHRHVDSFACSLPTFGTFNSDDLFHIIGVDRDSHKHNALDDAHASLTAVRTIHQLWKELVTPHI